jgi:hypothetical protein
MEIEISVAYIDMYYIKWVRGEYLCFTMVRAKFRKVNKMMFKVKNTQ